MSDAKTVQLYGAEVDFEVETVGAREPRSKFVAWLAKQSPVAGKAFVITTGLARQFVKESTGQRIATMAGFKLWLSAQLNSRTMKKAGWSFTVESTGHTKDGQLAAKVMPAKAK
jgi:hypothetical protein